MNTSELLIIANAIVLGFRHAIDWDHVAALMDITASSTLATSDGAAAIDSGQKSALWLSCLYGLGHCSIVVLIGMAACFCAGFVPDWLDKAMERCVGLTLLVFGIVVGFISLRSVQTGASPPAISRGRVLLLGLTRAWHFLRGERAQEFDSASQPAVTYGEHAAFGLGVIHGAGVETASQVFLLAAVGTSTNHIFALSILAYFSVGFLVSIMLISFLSLKGLRSVAKFGPIYVVSGFATAIFSIAIGGILLGGHSSILPDIVGSFR